MALADSSENAILDLSKRVAKEEQCALENNTNVSSFTSNNNVKAFSFEKMFKVFPDNKIPEKEKSEIKNHIEAETPSPDSLFFARTCSETLKRCSISLSPIPGDVRSFVNNSTTSALASNDRQIDRMWMKTLPHRKRPLNLFKSMEDSSGIDAKRVKTSFSDEACLFVPDKSDDQESLASSKSPEVFSPIDSPGKCDFIIKNHCNQILDDKSQSPERILTKSTSRTRSGQLKDEAYWERRRKNNEAAKRSRDTRKQKEEETALKARSLAQENISLRAEISILRTQLCNMQSMLFYRSNTHSLL